MNSGLKNGWKIKFHDNNKKKLAHNVGSTSNRLTTKPILLKHMLVYENQTSEMQFFGVKEFLS